MPAHHLRASVLAILASGPLLVGLVREAAAQADELNPPASVVRSFEELKSRLGAGATILVTDSGGHEARGRLRELSERSLTLLVNGEPRSFSPADVRLIEERTADSLWNGLLIGAAAGAVPALYWRFADPNECGNSICGDDLVRGMIPGAALGLAIDAAIRKKVIVYRATSTPSTRNILTIVPMVADRRTGFALVVAF